jgi:AcrR family transcriptional regulator
LLEAGRTLFAERGFDGTSVRALTSRAGANLGAVTYHFGSKESLYEAVADSLMRPLRERIARAAVSDRAPLDRVELSVRELFDYLQGHPDLPRFVVQQLAGAHPIPPAVRETLRANHTAVTGMIAEGQRDGTVREGDPRLLALSIAAQPIWVALVRRALHEAIGLDQEDPQTRRDLVENLVRFVRSGLTPAREDLETP